MLYASGRQGNTEQLNLDAVGIKVSSVLSFETIIFLTSLLFASSTIVVSFRSMRTFKPQCRTFTRLVTVLVFQRWPVQRWSKVFHISLTHTHTIVRYHDFFFFNFQDGLLRNTCLSRARKSRPSSFLVPNFELTFLGGLWIMAVFLRRWHLHHS